MSKLPRDISGSRLAKLLKPLGYEFERQVGSHMRYKTLREGGHSITIPNHNPVKTGTLSAILNDIANHFAISKEALIDMLF